MTSVVMVKAGFQDKKDRLLFFDILRIVAILLIVLGHLHGLVFLNIEYFLYNPEHYFNMIWFSAGTVGVGLFLFISGAVLEYTHRNISTIGELIQFYYKRLSRIYPVYWISLVITMFVAPVYLEKSTAGLISQISGFMSSPFHIQWFIGLIVFMYLIFPVLSKSMEKYPYIIIVSIFIISILSILYVNTYGAEFAGIDQQADRTFPLCNLIEFGLGIFLVQQNLYPKTINTSRTVQILSEMSFYIFLIHQPIRYALYGNPENIWSVNSWIFPSLFEFIILVLISSYLLMFIDKKLQAYLGLIVSKVH
jgi:peptidoglycan/LPS O-acetylase OafA/YrhL